MDQDTFNIIFRENVEYLSFFYNFQYNSWIHDKAALALYYDLEMTESKYEWIQRAVLIHYTWRKPWDYFDYFAADIWLHYYLISPVKDVPLTRKSLNEELIAEKEKELTIVRETVEKQEKELKELRKLRAEVQRFRNETIQLAAELAAVKTGWSFRIGRLLTWIPRKLLRRP